MKVILLVLISSLVLSACNGGGSGKKNKNDDGDRDGMRCERQGRSEVCTENSTNTPPVIIVDRVGEEYFNQFLFKEEDVSDDPDFPEVQYRFLMSGLHREFVSQEGEKRGLVLQIGLFEDKSFKALYKEIKFINDNGNFFPAGCKEISGNWFVENNKLVLVDNGIVVFSGEKFFSDDKHAVLFNQHMDYISVLPKAVKKVDLTLGYTNIGYPENMLFKCGFGF